MTNRVLGLLALCGLMIGAAQARAATQQIYDTQADAHRDVVSDGDLGLDLLDHLAAGANNLTNLLGVDMENIDSGRMIRETLSRLRQRG